MDKSRFVFGGLILETGKNDVVGKLWVSRTQGKGAEAVMGQTHYKMSLSLGI